MIENGGSKSGPKPRHTRRHLVHNTNTANTSTNDTNSSTFPGTLHAPLIENGVISLEDPIPYIAPCERASNDDQEKDPTPVDENCTDAPSMQPSWFDERSTNGVSGGGAGGGANGSGSGSGGGGGGSYSGSPSGADGGSGGGHDGQDGSGSDGVSHGVANSTLSGDASDAHEGGNNSTSEESFNGNGTDTGIMAGDKVNGSSTDNATSFDDNVEGNGNGNDSGSGSGSGSGGGSSGGNSGERVEDDDLITSIYCPSETLLLGNYTDHTVTGSDPNSSTNSTVIAHHSEIDIITVSYVYEVETANISSADTFLPQIEHEILIELAEVMMPCWKNDEDGEEIRRELTQSDKQVEECIGVESRPTDVHITEGPCTITSDRVHINCFLIDGGVTLLLLTNNSNNTNTNTTHSTDNHVTTSSAEETALAIIRTSMETNSLLYDYDQVTNVATPSTVPEEVIAIRYLGESLEDYLASAVHVNVDVDEDDDDDETWNVTNAINGTSESAASHDDVGAQDEFATVITEGDIVTAIYCPGAESIAANATDTDTTMSKNSTSNLDANATVANVSSEIILVSYVYEVETENVSSADSFLPQIEQEILMELAHVMMPCWKKGRSSKEVGGDDDDRRRNLVGSSSQMSLRPRSLEPSNEQQEGDDVEECIGVESRPTDMHITEGPCTISSNRADNCFLIDGGVTLHLANNINATAAEETARKIIQTSMENDKLLPDNDTTDNNTSTVPDEVINIRYLGDNMEDYLANFKESDNKVAIPGFTDTIDEDKVNGDSEAIAISVSLSILAILLFLLLLCCMRKRRRKRQSLYESEDELDAMPSKIPPRKSFKRSFASFGTKSKSRRDPSEGDGQEQYREDPEGIYEEDLEKALDADLDNILAGIDASNKRTNYYIDPPGSFHLGNHHYTADGVRYRSQRCELCQKARANGGEDEEEDEDGLEEKLSFDMDQAKHFKDYDCHELGGKHSSIHVRHCKSTTCDICMKARGVVFLKAGTKNGESA